ncbi:MAG: 16S rRNA (cytosine(1402)-N(4))-methyltransferase RsmH [Candidatus Eremiobacteraeota bacterium]|nr:16S rRNA (cytosine(1402)-N(4))-methyltransferase RsmH [Candidatus Eremiobacteraeota bacterium]
MLEECLTLLRSAGDEGAKVFVDATFGAGGHTAALLDAVPRSSVLAIDADPEAVRRADALARRYPGRLRSAHGNYGDIEKLLAAAQIDQVDAVLYDLGISSLQLGGEQRGFSFVADEPLDMRLDPTSQAATASDLLSTLPQDKLESILRDFGDERRARPIARSIVRRRPRLEVWRTSDLVAAVWSAFGKDAQRGHERIHPATRTFQALRIAVNAELENLRRSLHDALAHLKPRGRIVAISFHSGEDRVVKHAFREFEHEGVSVTITRKPVRPSAAETRANPRSRSAKLRATERVVAAAAAQRGHG